MFELINRVLYQEESRYLVQAWSAKISPFKSTLFYSFFGRILWGAKEFFALLLKGRVFKKSISLEGFDTTLDKMQKSYLRGDYHILWPKTPMVQSKTYQLSDDFSQKIANSLKIAEKKESQNFNKTKEWERIATAIREQFLYKDSSIKKRNLINFRSDTKLYEELFNDQFSYLDIDKPYIKSYLESIDLVLEYHRFAKKIDKILLASISESSAGNNLCVQYRGKRLSHKSLFHSVVVNDLIKTLPLSELKKGVILDIGAGYGGLSRMLKFFTPKSCHILLDLPETLIITSYFIKYNFPDAKIALLDTIEDKLDDFNNLIKEYDFIIIPPSILKSIDSESIDLVINSVSMGFMQEGYLNFYLKQINRTLKTGGYFYSLNKEYDDKWGIGTFNWDFKAEYLTLLYEHNNRFFYPQWLGKKQGKK